MDDSNIFHPPHYTAGDIECIDAIESAVSDPVSFLQGQVIKYVWRFNLKGNPVSDLKKARWYLDRIIDKMESLDG